MSTILITGAASGIGAATARLFHRQGWQVVLLACSGTFTQAWMTRCSAREAVFSGWAMPACD